MSYDKSTALEVATDFIAKMNEFNGKMSKAAHKDVMKYATDCAFALWGFLPEELGIELNHTNGQTPWCGRHSHG